MGENKLRVGYIGVGLMGHGAAKNILEKGKYPLTVIAHRNRVPVEDLANRGAIEVHSMAELANNSDVVFMWCSGSAWVLRSFCWLMVSIWRFTVTREILLNGPLMTSSTGWNPMLFP